MTKRFACILSGIVSGTGSLGRPALVLSLFLLGGCLENEETITIRPDGSAHVRHAVGGDLADLADGHPLPAEPRWQLVEGRLDGPGGQVAWRGSEGRAALEALLAGVASKTAAIDSQAKAELVFEAEFGSVRDLDERFAPASDPYASAYLARVQRVDVRTFGSRRVYTFERTYRARAHARYDVWARLEHEIGHELRGRIEAGGPLSEQERDETAREAEDAMRRASAAFVDDALLADFVDPSKLQDATDRKPAGQGNVIRAASVVAIRAAVAGDLARRITPERLRSILDLLCGPAKDEKEAGVRIESLGVEIRTALRSELARGLAEERVPLESQNAICAELEWLFTAADHTSDLGDEGFRVVVRMPGTVVGGNFDELAGEAAAWEFTGADLRDRERVLRVVSVVE